MTKDVIPMATVQISLRCKMLIPGTVEQVQRLIETTGIALRPTLIQAIKDNEADIQYKVLAPSQSDQMRIEHKRQREKQLTHRKAKQLEDSRTVNDYYDK